MLAFCIRALALWQLPLLVTNDGADYASWAMDLADGVWPTFPPFRTPGYSVFLAGIFSVAVSPILLQGVQHLLGITTACCVAWGIKRSGRPRAALLIGSLVAVDPRLLAFETVLLSETLTTTLVTLGGMLALHNPPQRNGTIQPILLGVLVGLACLVRPAVQVVVPFFLVAAAFSGTPKRFAARLLLSSLAIVLTVAPWCIYNANRGIIGLSGAKPVYLWYGLAHNGLLTDEHAPTEFVESYQRNLSENPADIEGFFAFVNEHNAWKDADVQRQLQAWSLSCIRDRPFAYAKAASRSFFWQLDTYPGDQFQETAWFVKSHRLRRIDRPDFDDNMLTSNTSRIEGLRVTREPGVMAVLLAQWSQVGMAGAVTAGFYTVAGVVCMLGVASRPKPMLLFLGCSALILAHAVYLSPYSRYSMPVWPLLAVLVVRGIRPAQTDTAEIDSS